MRQGAIGEADAQEASSREKKMLDAVRTSVFADARVWAGGQVEAASGG